MTRAQAHYAAAAPGIVLLSPASQACMRTAYALYGGILDEVAAADYDVFVRRAVVPRARRAAVAGRALVTPTGTPVVVPGPAIAPDDRAADRARRRTADPRPEPTADRSGSVVEPAVKRRDGRELSG
ncbi:hypothetical protein GCM10027605_71850 [Micromonospora zhanjiangensis]